MSSKNDIVTCLKQVAIFLKVQPGKLSYNEDGICTHTKNKVTTKGVLNIINQFLNDSKSDLRGKTHEEKVFTRQWIEYSVVYAASTEEYSNIFKTLNDVFLHKTYLLGNRLTISDLILYYIMQNKMDKLSYLEKEKFMNMCRWFDNLQQNALIRQSNKLIDFNTIYLATIVPVKH